MTCGVTDRGDMWGDTQAEGTQGAICGVTDRGDTWGDTQAEGTQLDTEVTLGAAQPELAPLWFGLGGMGGENGAWGHRTTGGH